MVPVDLQFVVDEMDGFSDDWAACINRKTGEIFLYSEIELYLQEDNEENVLAIRQALSD